MENKRKFRPNNDLEYEFRARVKSKLAPGLTRFNERTMICEFCGGKTLKKKVRRQHWLHSKLYIVENVEAEVCTDCGERYFHATTLDDIDRYLSAEHEIIKQINVEVVSLK